MEAITSNKGDFNLKTLEERNFRWSEVEKDFSWYYSGQVNLAYEAIDKHAEGYRKNKLALIYKDETRSEKYTFHEMKEWTNRVGNVLKEHGVKKGDAICFFMPRIPELYFSILGAIKLGAIVIPLFETFMEGALHERILDSGAKFLVTTKKLLSRIPEVDLAKMEKVFLFGDEVEEKDNILSLTERSLRASKHLKITWVDLEDGLMVHYTSSLNGKPRGIYHVHYGMVQHYWTGKWVLDLQEEDLYWCTALPGWLVGTSYGMFAPWLNGATNCVIGGSFNPEFWCRAIEELGITVWFSTPTVFRMFMGFEHQRLKEFDFSSLRHIFSVGEPLSVEMIHWGKEVFHRYIHDTYLSTETGAIMIGNYPGLELRIGSMGKALPGIEARVIDQDGTILSPYQTGQLAIFKGWPSMMRGIWNNKDEFESLFLPKGWYLTGDFVYKDEDGYFWFQGRMKEDILTRHEGISPFEVEGKLLEHPAVAEAAVIGKPDPLHGELIKAFIVLKPGFFPSKDLEKELCEFVQSHLSSTVLLQEMEFTDSLPKTRSGKIMRRVLKAREQDLAFGS